MPSPNLLNAISRLDQAVSRAEASLDIALAEMSGRKDDHEAVIKRAITELDTIIATLGSQTDG